MTEDKDDRRDTASRAANAPKKAADRAGFQFNQVGSEEPASRVLVPQVDPAARRRTLLIVCLAVIAVLVLILVVANPFGIERTGGAGKGGGPFNPPPAGETGL